MAALNSKRLLEGNRYSPQPDLIAKKKYLGKVTSRRKFWLVKYEKE
jgi:hypothetical protein